MKSLILFFLTTLCALTIAAEPTLPRVLILGDSNYQEPTQQLANQLKGKVEVVHSRLQTHEVLHTGIAPARLDELLGDKKWDIIHFNFGLGDLLHKAPNLKTLRTMPKHIGGIRVTTPAQYEKNLHIIVARLKTTGAKLIWASTTPIRASATGVFEVGSEIEYNTIAAKVMAQHKVPINDMYAYAKSVMNMDKPASHGFDPFDFDRQPLHPPILTLIQTYLKLTK